MNEIKINLNKSQYDSLLFCTNGKNKITAKDMLVHFKPFLGKDLEKIACHYNGVFVFELS